MRAWASVFLLSILLAAAGIRWVQFEYCNLQAVLNTTDTPCSCLLTSFNPQQDGTAIPVTSGISAVNTQVCDIIFETNTTDFILADIFTIKYYDRKIAISKVTLRENWQPPESILS